MCVQAAGFRTANSRVRTAVVCVFAVCFVFKRTEWWRGVSNYVWHIPRFCSSELWLSVLGHPGKFCLWVLVLTAGTQSVFCEALGTCGAVF